MTTAEMKSELPKIGLYSKEWEKYNLVGFTQKQMRYLVENDMMGYNYTKEQQEALKVLVEENERLGNIK